MLMSTFCIRFSLNSKSYVKKQDGKILTILQVAEITTLEDCRLSINGWFHGRIPASVELPPEPSCHNSVLKAKVVDIDLESWISDEYLNVNAMNVIQRQIEENSEISLRNFFKHESFNEILQTLQSKGNQILIYVI